MTEYTFLNFVKPKWLNELLLEQGGDLSSEKLGALLRSFARINGRLGGFTQAAAITDAEGRLIDCNVDLRVAYQDNALHAARVVMLTALRALNSGATLKDLKLHILANKSIESQGQIWLFAPGKVFIHKLPEDLDKSLETSLVKIPEISSFWDEAKRERGISVEYFKDSSEAFSHETIDQIAEQHRAERQRAIDIKSAPFPSPAWIEDIKQDLLQPLDALKLIETLHSVAAQNVKNGGGPFAAAVLDPSGNIVDLNVNMVVPFKDCGAHAEKVVATNALWRLGRSDLRGYRVFSSASPCVGCAEQLAHLRPDEVIYCVPRERVEALAAFKEGPVTASYWKQLHDDYGIKCEGPVEFERLREVAEAPFKAHAARVARQPELEYLT